jgi:hypothetical protein
MNQPVDPDRTRLDLNPVEELPPQPMQEPLVEESVADADHRRRRTVGVVCTVINVVSAVFAVVLALHIVLVIGEANQANGFAGFVNDLSSAVSLGLRDLFVPDNLKLRTFLNDGLAAVGWLLIAGVLTYLIRRLALPGPRRVVRYRRVVR